MWWQYLLVFIGAMLVDIVPFPFPPAFTVMIFLQIYYRLDIWLVIIIGVAGSILGRLILTLYIPKVSDHIFTQDKNEDVLFLGAKMKDKVWRCMGFVLLYSLLPLPTTPLFLAGGMARMKPYVMIPPFTIGKFTSDMVTVLLGSYAARNTETLLNGIVSWESITGTVLGLILVCAFILIDWRSLLLNKKLVIKFNVWK